MESAVAVDFVGMWVNRRVIHISIKINIENEYEKSNSTDTNWRLCLTLCSCGKNKAVKNTESLISTIGQIFVNSVVSVVAAKKA